jgi:glycerate kinase
VRVVIAPDKFKGSLTAPQVTQRVAAGLSRAAPSVDVVQVPVADGGEGTLEAAAAAGFRLVQVRAAGPLGAPLLSTLAVRGGTAVIELATASGLAQLPDGTPEPLKATSLGTGAQKVVLALGGSACTDGGAGLLLGLGARLLDADKRDLGPCGGALPSLERIDRSGLDPRLNDARIVLATDVDNPLLGEHGAAAVYGPQKGAGPGRCRPAGTRAGPLGGGPGRSARPASNSRQPCPAARSRRCWRPGLCRNGRPGSSAPPGH